MTGLLGVKRPLSRTVWSGLLDCPQTIDDACATTVRIECIWVQTSFPRPQWQNKSFWGRGSHALGQVVAERSKDHVVDPVRRDEGARRTGTGP